MPTAKTSPRQPVPRNRTRQEEGGRRRGPGRGARSEAQTALARPQAPPAALVLEGLSTCARARTEAVSAAEVRPWIWCTRREIAAVFLAITARGREPRTVIAARPVFGGVDPQLATVDLLPVEAPNRFCRFRFAGELDERKAPRPTSFPIGPDVNVLDLPSA